ncbi:unnamed protein product [Brassica rapa]|uniref:Uncharacterized protein n=1 Tax=Brassica campestris TaxID=3711 RepID=A0A3P5YYP1_BRACM|nr:unnamed protein product [Brassica rapa]VDC64988.1 unnamed protein product [Brassica rapa]
MAGFASPNVTAQFHSKTKIEERVDYSNLPCPKPYEDIHLEATKSLKPELFEGFRLNYTKRMNHKFSLIHSLLMGNSEFPAERSQHIFKTPTSSYEFGANLIDPKLMLDGRLMMDGTVIARFNSVLKENFTIKTTAQLTNELDQSQGVFTVDYKGSDYRTQFQLGNYKNQFKPGTSSLFRANYIQHVTPKVSLGGEVLYLSEHRKSVVGYVARYETDKMVASGQVASSGVAIMNYVHKVTDKISLAAEFFYSFMLRDGAASVGYDLMFRQSRVRGKIDSNGVVFAHVEEQLCPGLGLLLCAEVDHVKTDYKFGLGVQYEGL